MVRSLVIQTPRLYCIPWKVNAVEGCLKQHQSSVLHQERLSRVSTGPQHLQEGRYSGGSFVVNARCASFIYLEAIFRTWNNLHILLFLEAKRQASSLVTTQRTPNINNNCQQYWPCVRHILGHSYRCGHRHITIIVAILPLLLVTSPRHIINKNWYGP